MKNNRSAAASQQAMELSEEAHLHLQASMNASASATDSLQTDIGYWQNKVSTETTLTPL